VQPQQAELGAA
jgi:hypothetical protein